MRKHLLKQT